MIGPEAVGKAKKKVLDARVMSTNPSSTIPTSRQTFSNQHIAN
jgi:tRNA A37 threonylcarbamoyladenosine dehydratase